ncbi:MAG TPA: nitroreductase family protein [Aggregatilineales bacterium]|nr:nitroreductase family protein [Aggregatilineales bacterium]
MIPDTLDVLIRSRRSIRRYQDRPVEHATIERLLTAAVWGPSAHNRQPWRFAVTTSAETKQTLARAMGARLRIDLVTDGASPEVIERDTGRSYDRITRAPALILVCLSMVDMDSYPDPRRAGFEHHMAAQSVAIAVQNLLLTAHAEGLGACWMCAPLFCPDVVLAALDLPSEWEPQALITLGYPAETRTSTRAALDTKVIWR